MMHIKIRPIFVFAIIPSVFLINRSQVWSPNLIDVNQPLVNHTTLVRFFTARVFCSTTHYRQQVLLKCTFEVRSCSQTLLNYLNAATHIVVLAVY